MQPPCEAAIVERYLWSGPRGAPTHGSPTQTRFKKRICSPFALGAAYDDCNEYFASRAKYVPI